MKNKLTLIALLGALGVILGALGAHSLRPLLSDIQFNSYETGIRYLFIHTLAMWVLVILMMNHPNRLFTVAFQCFFIGTLLFSGSILCLTTLHLTGLGFMRVLAGPATPIGGLVLIIGWGSLGIGARKITFIN